MIGRSAILVVAFALVAVAPAATAARVEATAATPALRLVQKVPLKVRGLNFKRSERVRVVAVYRDTTYTRIVRASTTGTFVATFIVEVNLACGLEVRGVGAGGSRAVIKLPERFCPIDGAPAELAYARR